MFGFSKNKNTNRVVRTAPAASAGLRVVSDRKKRAPISGAGKSIWIRIAVVFLMLAFFGTAIFIFFFSDFLSIKTIDISGTESVPQERAREIIIAEMAGKIDGIFRRDNLIFLDIENMKKNLPDAYQIIEKVEITRKFPDKLIIKLQERKTLLNYCSGGECFVIDSKGNAFAKFDFEKNEFGEKNLIVINDESGKKISTDDFSANLDFLQFALEIKYCLEDESIPVKMNFSTPTVVSGDLRVETESGWKIYFNQKIGADREIEMLKTVLKNSIDKKSQADLEYIDLRLDNKVYYKLKTAPPVAEENKEIVPAVEVKNEKRKK